MKKTNKMMTGVIAALVGTSLTGCGMIANGDIPEPPSGTDCGDWEWENGQWECDDYDSDYYGYYFLGGAFYRTAKAKSKLPSKIISSSASSSTIKSGTGGKTSSGFGTSSKSGGYTGG